MLNGQGLVLTPCLGNLLAAQCIQDSTVKSRFSLTPHISQHEDLSEACLLLAANVHRGVLQGLGSRFSRARSCLLLPPVRQRLRGKPFSCSRPVAVLTLHEAGQRPSRRSSW
ncbi:uncharacterized protein B0I36DRAFT_329642 [Microdochium trichocladiopsis]|uniref:Uncharacterized protein n=1 Tax=Microdochium trichocladiopsis TaxID=1682393 RepID=A0A9P8Y2H8_9PEZI|nr:uncharacterized protein B0I36DRAFT_329642 [Microdochium trichocladiopsis]KAH7025987.1 hypothetical protein B0I36DRAFT_329642 [Microdochium trichocladiopsis]